MYLRFETSVDPGLGLMPLDEAAWIALAFIKPHINQGFFVVRQFSIVEPIRAIDLRE
jgi:hypothetical protein